MSYDGSTYTVHTQWGRLPAEECCYKRVRQGLNTNSSGSGNCSTHRIAQDYSSLGSSYRNAGRGPLNAVVVGSRATARLRVTTTTRRRKQRWIVWERKVNSTRRQLSEVGAFSKTFHCVVLKAAKSWRWPTVVTSWFWAHLFDDDWEAHCGGHHSSASTVAMSLYRNPVGYRIITVAPFALETSEFWALGGVFHPIACLLFR